MTITILGFSSSLFLAGEALAGDFGALFLDSEDLIDLADLADLADLFDYVGSTANDTVIEPLISLFFPVGVRSGIL